MKTLLACLISLWSTVLAVAAYDHSHAVLTGVLKERVTATGAVHYAALKAQPQALGRWLADAAAVTRPEFDAWTRPQQLAFLINLYNAATLKLVIDHHPVKSLKDIGGLRGPWKVKGVHLWGRLTTLHDIEHTLIRRGYAEPRSHFALVCAAQGCPPLRAEAYVADRLFAQLDDQGRRFLAETTKNRWDAATQTLWLSPIFKWFAEDFEASSAGSVVAYVHPRWPTPLPATALSAKIRYTDYDWTLNAAP